MAQRGRLENSTMQEKNQKHQPEGTIVYIVQESDTLERIAAHFNTTPSELKKLNKLISSMLYPGQKLFIPGLDYIPRKSVISVSSNEDSSGPSESAGNSMDKCQSLDLVFGSPLDKPIMDIPLVRAGNVSPTKVPGHAERQISVSSPKEVFDFELVPPRRLSEDEVNQLDTDCVEKFIKINVRYVTDGQGVVKGTLLVTPNTVMFDPDVLDPLVMEHGAEKYGMIAPMDMIISAAMYHNISCMKMRGQILDDGSKYHMPEVYHNHTCPVAKERLQSRQLQALVSSALPENLHQILSNPLTKISSVCSCGAMDSIVSTACDDDCEEADDNDDKDGDNFSEECMKNEHSDFIFHKALCAMEEDKFYQDSPDKICDFKADELSILKTEAKSDLVVVADDNLNVHELDNVTDGDGNKMKLNIKQGGVQKKLTVTFSLSDLDEVKSTNKTLTNNEMNTNTDTSFKDDSKTIDIDKDIFKKAPTMDQISKDSGVKCLEMTDDTRTIDIDKGICKEMPKMEQISESDKKCLEITGNSKAVAFDKDIFKKAHKLDHINKAEDSDKKCLANTEISDSDTNAGIGFFLPVEEDSNDQVPEDYIKETQTMLSVLDSKECIDILNPESENSDSVDTSKNATPCVDFACTSSTSSLGPVSSTPHLNAFVNYASGFFQRHQSVKDISDVLINPVMVTDFKPEESLLQTKLDVPVVAETSGKKHGKLSRHGDANAVAMESNKNTVVVESAITMDEKPDLLTMDYKKFAPKHAAIVQDPPLYLCLRLGRRPDEKPSFHNYPIESYGKRRKRSEYWFSIPREKVDHLYAFFVQCTPEIYGDDEEITPEKRGFIVIDDDYEEDEEDHFNLNSKLHKDWEIVSQGEALKRRSILFEIPIPLPELIGESSILTEEHIRSLNQVMLGRIVGYPWNLIYSTYRDGFSLHTMYRVMVGLDSPVLLVVLDDRDSVFGALTSCSLKVSDGFYGTGESFLYTFYPEFKVFTWSGANNFFVKGSKEGLSVGAGHGVFGLWFDEDLYHGRTDRCETFNNDLLTCSEDFIVKGFEAWAFLWD